MPKKKPTKASPPADLDFDSMIGIGGIDLGDELPDVDVALPGDEEEDGEPQDVAEATKGELAQLQTDFQKRAKREDDRFLEAVDTEFWFAVCFQNRAQKEEFLTKLKLMSIGDKYLDGAQVAAKLGIKLTAKGPEWRTKSPNKRLKELA